MGPDWDGDDRFGPHGPWFGPGGFRGPRGDGPWYDGPGWWPVVPMALTALTALVLTALVLALLWRSGRLPGRRPRAVAAAGTDWPGAVRRHRELAAEYAAFECDPRAVLDLPALVDVRQPATARFVEAFAEATALLTDARPTEPYARRFAAAVERAERAWAAAVETARRRGTAGFSADERALLDQVRTLLDVVASSDFEAERRAAFEQARNRFAELEKRTGWRLPAPAAAAVEDGVRPALAR
jgi:hypothetical protein